MTVHAIRVETSKISEGVPLDTIVRSVVTSRRTVLPEEEGAFQLYDPTPEEPLAESYRGGLWRFEEADYDRDELLDAFENALRGPAKWARIRYHVCDSDDPIDGFECEWGDEVPPRIIGTPPAELPGPTSK